jgi:gamma-glutamyltranspeptidase
MKFQKGKPRHPNAGRKRGTPNKLGAFAKSQAMLIFDQLGGTFLEWAKKNQTEFYIGFLARSMPRDLEISGSLTHEFDFAEAAEAFERALDAVIRARRIEKASPKLIEAMSAFGGKADMERTLRNVRY